mmetsp:Transcript_23102/g.37890  ORF Transcript_23102/g.37890 Transcript_23102/m.37890 type:complete len:230 (+) Transcript_23102:92-781(+)
MVHHRQHPSVAGPSPDPQASGCPVGMLPSHQASDRCRAGGTHANTEAVEPRLLFAWAHGTLRSARPHALSVGRRALRQAVLPARQQPQQRSRLPPTALDVAAGTEAELAESGAAGAVVAAAAPSRSDSGALGQSWLSAWRSARQANLAKMAEVSMMAELSTLQQLFSWQWPPRKTAVPPATETANPAERLEHIANAECADGRGKARPCPHDCLPVPPRPDLVPTEEQMG